MEDHPSPQTHRAVDRRPEQIRRDGHEVAIRAGGIVEHLGTDRTHEVDKSMCDGLGHRFGAPPDQNAELTRARIASRHRATAMHRDPFEVAVPGRQLVGPRGGGDGAGGEDLDVPPLHRDEVFTEEAQPVLDPSDDVHPVAGDHQPEFHSWARTTTR